MRESETPVDVDRLIDEGQWTPFQTMTVGLCAAVTVIDGFDTQAIAYVAPVLAKEWGLGPAAFGPVFSVGLIGMMVGALALGPIADRFGRKLAIVASVALMAVFSLATMFAQSIETLIVLRFLTGLGLGGAMPNVIALSAEYTPARWRSTAVGVMFCGFPFGAVVGGLLAAQMIPAFGWQSVFLVGGVVPLVLMAVLIPVLPESVRFLVTRSGAEARAAKLIARAVPNARLPEKPTFLTSQKVNDANRTTARAELFGPSRIAITLLLWVTFFMNLLMYYFLISWLPLTLQHAGIALSRAILFTALLNAGGIVGTIVLARVIDRAGSFRILGGVLFAAAFAIAAIGYVGTEGGLALAVAVFVAGFCVNGAQNNMNALAAGIYSTPARSTGVGFALGIGRVGSILGPVVGGVLLSASMPLQTLFLIGALPALIAASTMFFLNRRTHPQVAVATVPGH
ncbi:AAHS family 4-hydroxybenzoate transporter-like MFS transporter [Pseudochelatococcus lubricantis]|uniref:AAHS family 4-hydroxybenzoate transporter-like MFS transporter n=1 Tax=Pseudochelatococcus lubricantis TaxID=1538102 RepID=A0ABX0V639_9HYPH|nr:MFS transporter [Pseudochelatococcus lubricantis]NIJ59960.1 AAHS family 4-hydroxybenzoate transporter-like MFS transporter [Pseudochelatococcus lubricantis]